MGARGSGPGESSMDAAYFRQLARYNIWANERIYGTCAELSDAERKQARSCFFGSIHRTLNHILVGTAPGSRG